MLACLFVYVWICTNFFFLQNYRDESLEEHIKFLESLGIAGVSHHSLLFSKTAPVAAVQEEEEIARWLALNLVANLVSVMRCIWWDRNGLHGLCRRIYIFDKNRCMFRPNEQTMALLTLFKISNLSNVSYRTCSIKVIYFFFIVFGACLTSLDCNGWLALLYW